MKRNAPALAGIQRFSNSMGWATSFGFVGPIWRKFLEVFQHTACACAYAPLFIVFDPSSCLEAPRYWTFQAQQDCQVLPLRHQPLPSLVAPDGGSDNPCHFQDWYDFSIHLFLDIYIYIYHIYYIFVHRVTIYIVYETAFIIFHLLSVWCLKLWVALLGIFFLRKLLIKCLSGVVRA